MILREIKCVSSILIHQMALILTSMPEPSGECFSYRLWQWWYLTKRAPLKQCSFNAGSASQNMGQHWNYIGSMSHFCWDILPLRGLSSRLRWWQPVLYTPSGTGLQCHSFFLSLSRTPLRGFQCQLPRNEGDLHQLEETINNQSWIVSETQLQVSENSDWKIWRLKVLNPFSAGINYRQSESGVWERQTLTSKDDNHTERVEYL